jgi:uncharacterized membrane protein
MKTYPGITEETVEPHERMGLYFFIGVLLLAVASAAGAFLAKGREAILKKFNLYLIVCAVIVCIFGVIAGSTGGKIKHNEITQGVYQKH